MSGSNPGPIALFVPCYVDALWPEVGKAVVALFDRIGVRFEYPMEQTCCGQPAFNAGYWDEARALARRFGNVFAKYERIVVPSGSCAAMCCKMYEYMDPHEGQARVGARVRDLATFLVDDLGITDVGACFPHTVTYLDGCHARRELGSSQAAVALLRAVDGLRYVELPLIEECCGFGGTFSVKYAALSSSMALAKCANVAATGADVVASSDASCLLHLGGALSRARSPVRAMHLAEILARR